MLKFSSEVTTMKNVNKYTKSRIGHGGQRGGLTIFSAALILILMTLVLVYATRVSVYETRVSGNEVRQKEAFHVAEAAIDQGIMYFLANANLVVSSRENVFPDGTSGSFSRDGWLPPSSGAKWVACPTNPDITHPCGGAVPAKAGSYYYDLDPSSATVDSLPINNLDFPTGTTAKVSALMCVVDLTNPTSDCGVGGGTAEDEANSSLVVTLLGYGYSDCTDVTTVTSCTGRATVAVPLGTDRKFTGSPAVPLVSKSTTPLDGTFEVVGNPNGGGVGVPLTTWIDADSGLLSGGTWQTCEMEEWYHTPERPEGVACTDNNCLCGLGGNDTSHFLSWKKATDSNINIDIILDTNFPDDLFEFYFGVPRAQYQTIKGSAKQLNDCTSLGPDSSGVIWINGTDCRINGGAVIGSPLAPVVLVSAANLTTINAGAVIFGVLYIFDDDPAGSTAELTATGGATVYGAVIVDGAIDKLQGTFQVVFNESVLATATGYAGVGTMNGGWRDFGLPEIVW
jgi:hypothetical protein